MSNEQTESAVHAFFSNYFDYFIGKHTDWLLLNEPDTSKITPIVLNTMIRDLNHTFESKINKQTASKEGPNDNLKGVDLNKVVADISAERTDRELR